MDCVSPILTIATDLFDCTAKRASHIRGLRENLECLREEMELLNLRSEDVKTRVELGKQQQMTPRREVEGWLQGVGEEKIEVAAILQEGDGALEKECLGRYCNIRSSYNLGKRVSRKIRRVRELTSRGGDFEVVADMLPPAPAVGDELPLGPTVGLDLLYQKVCSCLSEDKVGIVGLYGIRGVGKTTLLKKINNGLLETSHDFDMVIWAAVSKQTSYKIFNIMKAKRFLLLLDNVRQRLDLPEIGVPPPDARNRSKVIITTRSMRICNEMEAQRIFKVEPLEREEALTLFRELVGEDTISSHPRIQDLAYIVTERCKGLPSTVVNAGRKLAGMKDVWYWEKVTRKPEDFIKEISGMIRNDEHIAHFYAGKNRLRQAVVDEMPLGYTVGLDWLYERVCSCLTDYKVKIIGLYGIGGVGKTTLMKKINNRFLETGHRFNIVIWVAMSKQANVRAAQEVIRNKLQIPDSMWQSRTEDERAGEIFNIMKRKRFVLLLDDVWQRLDLLKIGVPPLPEIRNESKVIITTRIQKICNEMEVQRKFRKVGENTLNSHPDIPQLSEKVAERCKGLPLALITVGKAMAHKNSPHEWDQAIQELEKFPVEISGMEDGLFLVLKLSYDSLRDDITKSCFIYCSFFPKEYEIRNDELIEHWIGEGFFDGKDIYEARRRGYKIIEDLKNACLLEEGDGFKECIKMHDVIHDMALWIGRECGDKMNKIWVCESLGLVDAERVTKWKEAETISLWGRNIEKLPETPHCSNLQTLFVRECIQLKTFPRGFFQFMPLIRILDLSATHCLTELPDGIEGLVHLEYINLSMTYVKKLPIGMTKLTKLKCLLLDGMPPLIIPPHLISSLSSLQLFTMYDGNAFSEYRTNLLEELESIEPVDELSLSFRSVVALNKFLSSYKLQRCIRRLSLHDCRDLLLLELSSIFLSYLETFVIFNCHQLEEMKINVEKRKLRDVNIWTCPKLLNLTWLIYAAHLQSLNVQFCESMKEVISNEYVTSSTQHASIFTRLTSLLLDGMPMLESIYRGLSRLPIDSISAAKSLKKIGGDLTWWGRLEWEDVSVEEIFANYFSAQYLAEPIQDPATHRKVPLAQNRESEGKKILVVEGSTSRTAT
ncbi:hypothetical protein AAG906_000011 [Vitis piasezkii]